MISLRAFFPIIFLFSPVLFPYLAVKCWNSLQDQKIYFRIIQLYNNRNFDQAKKLYESIDKDDFHKWFFMYYSMKDYLLFIQYINTDYHD